LSLSFDLCVVCPCELWLPLWYLQTLLCTKPGKCSIVDMCVRNTNFASFLAIFRLYFGTFLSVSFYFILETHKLVNFNLSICVDSILTRRVYTFVQTKCFSQVWLICVKWERNKHQVFWYDGFMQVFQLSSPINITAIRNTILLTGDGTRQDVSRPSFIHPWWYWVIWLVDFVRNIHFKVFQTRKTN
jgi:hypothetical protein